MTSGARARENARLDAGATGTRYKTGFLVSEDDTATIRNRTRRPRTTAYRCSVSFLSASSLSGSTPR